MRLDNSAAEPTLNVPFIWRSGKQHCRHPLGAPAPVREIKAESRFQHPFVGIYG